MDVPGKVMKQVGKAAETVADVAGSAVGGVIGAGRKLMPGGAASKPRTRRTKAASSGTASSTKGASSSSTRKRKSGS